MNNIMKDLTAILNRAFELKHTGERRRMFYEELLKGDNARKLIEKSSMISREDEYREERARHRASNAAPWLKLRIKDDYLKGDREGNLRGMVEAQFKAEKDALDLFKKICQKPVDGRKIPNDEFKTLKHNISNSTDNENQHPMELTLFISTPAKATRLRA